MSTHTWHCVVCHEPTYCCNDEHALGSGRGSACDKEPTAIEFCSLDCFKELAARMAERWRVVSRLDETGNGLDGMDGWKYLGLRQVPFPHNLPANAPWTDEELAAGRVESSPFTRMLEGVTR